MTKWFETLSSASHVEHEDLIKVVSFWKGDVSLLNIIVLIAEHFVDERLCVTGLTISSNNGNKTGDFHLLQIFILNLMIGMKNVHLITDCRALERHSGNDSSMSDN